MEVFGPSRKLIDFLETRSLHFARADTLGDPYEGTWPELNIVVREQHLSKIVAAYKGKIELERYRRVIEDMTRFTRQTMYINSWGGGETENAAMWKLYGTRTGSMVIQSTYKKLLDALPDNTYLGMVQYQDLQQPRKGDPYWQRHVSVHVQAKRTRTRKGSSCLQLDIGR